MPQSRPRLPALTLATSTLVSVVAVAVVTPAVAHGEPLPSETPLPSCLDKTIKDELGRELHPRGVQKRPFTKDGRLELIARGGRKVQLPLRRAWSRSALATPASAY